VSLLEYNIYIHTYTHAHTHARTHTRAHNAHTHTQIWFNLLNLVHTGNIQILAIFHNSAAKEHGFQSKLV